MGVKPLVCSAIKDFRTLRAILPHLTRNSAAPYVQFCRTLRAVLPHLTRSSAASRADQRNTCGNPNS